ERLGIDSVAPGEGLTGRIFETGRSMRIGTQAEQAELGSIEVVGSFPTQSYLGVPIATGARVIGVISLNMVEANAFSEADERLLNTLATSMGVALENARLFDETKRLLAETEQRNAELAVINDIGVALVEQL